jgi:hypothetical protein
MQNSSMVSVNPQGHHDHPARDPHALESSRFPSVLAVEVPCVLASTRFPKGECLRCEVGQARNPIHFLILGRNHILISTSRFQHRAGSNHVNASFSNEFEIVGCVPLALVRPKFWPSFRFHYRGDSGLACATNLYCVYDLRCVRFSRRLHS